MLPSALASVLGHRQCQRQLWGQTFFCSPEQSTTTQRIRVQVQGCAAELAWVPSPFSDLHNHPRPPGALLLPLEVHSRFQTHINVTPQGPSAMLYQSENMDVLVSGHQMSVLGSACGCLQLVPREHPNLKSQQADGPEGWGSDAGLSPGQ